MTTRNRIQIGLISSALGLSACGTMGLNTYSPDAIDPADIDDRPSEPVENGDVSEEDSFSDPDSDDEYVEPDVEEDEPSGQNGGESEQPSCTYDLFPVAMHQATQDNSNPGQPMFIYQARNTDQQPFDELQILSYQADPYFGPASAGTYNLSGGNYADCALCVLVIGDCNNEYSCDQVFFAAEGTLSVQSLSDHGGPFRATLRDAVFEEVSIDSSTYESSPIPGGDTWCIDEITIDVNTYLYD